MDALQNAMERDGLILAHDAAPRLAETPTNAVINLTWGMARHLPDVSADPRQMDPKTLEVSRLIGTNVHSVELLEVAANRIRVAVRTSWKGLLPQYMTYGVYKHKGIPVGTAVMHVVDIDERTEPPTAVIVFVPKD